jgi:hypothetical protein
VACQNAAASASRRTNARSTTGCTALNLLFRLKNVPVMGIVWQQKAFTLTGRQSAASLDSPHFLKNVWACKRMA